MHVTPCAAPASSLLLPLLLQLAPCLPCCPAAACYRRCCCCWRLAGSCQWGVWDEPRQQELLYNCCMAALGCQVRRGGRLRTRTGGKPVHPQSTITPTEAAALREHMCSHRCTRADATPSAVFLPQGLTSRPAACTRLPAMISLPATSALPLHAAWCSAGARQGEGHSVGGSVRDV